MPSALALVRRTGLDTKGVCPVLGDSVAAMGDQEIGEVVVDEDALRGKGTSPAADFASYLLGAVRRRTNGSGPLMHRTGMDVFFPDCGESVVLEISFPKAQLATMAVEVLAVAFTLRKDFLLFPFLCEGERITLRIRRHGQLWDMHVRGPISRAPDDVHGIVGGIRCELRHYLERRES